MKNAIVIGAYINTPEKENILYEALLQLRKLELLIIVTSSSILSHRIVELCDYHIYDKENTLLPIDRSPLYWYADGTETIHLYNRGISYVIIKKLNLSLHLLQNIKIDNFVYLEYDNIIHDDDLIKVKDMFTALETKKAFFCKASNEWLESRIFAGNVKFFLDNLPLPISYEEWIVTEPYSTRYETLEILFSIIFEPLMKDIAVTQGYNKDYFDKSKIDLFSIAKEINIIYNKETIDNPLLFLIGSDSSYDIFIDGCKIDTCYLNMGEVKKYYIELIDDKDTVVEVKYRDTEKTFVINKQNIGTYETIGCRYKL
jgi:hypothetical protein